MIEIKSEREIALLKEAGRIVALCHEEMKKQVRPGVSTQELNDICERIILEHNATPSFKGYGGDLGKTLEETIEEQLKENYDIYFDKIKKEKAE